MCQARGGCLSMSKTHTTKLITKWKLTWILYHSIRATANLWLLQCAVFFTLVSHLHTIHLYSRARMRLLSPRVCFPATMHKSGSFSPCLWRHRIWGSFSDSLLLVDIDLSWYQWSEENLPHAAHILLWILSRDMLAAKMIYRRFGAQDVLGRPICLLRYKRICFPCTGDLDSTLCSHLLTKSGSWTSGTWV